MNINKCPAMREYNVFGIDDKPCCYNEMKYCEDIPNCEYKRLINKLERIEDRVQDLNNYSENNINVMNDILGIIKEE